jgi:autotransporter-associated beta strand protein
MRSALLVLLLLAALPAAAADRTWTGLGDGTSFTDRFNWTDDAVPGVNDHAIIGGSAVVRVTTGSIRQLTLDGSARLNVEGQVILDAGGALVGPQATLALAAGTPNLFVSGGGVLRVEGLLDWSVGATVSSFNTAQIIVGPTGRVEVTGAGARTLNLPVTSEGTIRLAHIGTFTLNNVITSTGQIEVDATEPLSFGTGSGQIVSSGPFVKRGDATATFTLSNGLVALGGPEAVDVQAGALVLAGPTRWTEAGVRVAAGARLELGGQGWHEVAGTLSGSPAGTVALNTSQIWGLVAATSGGTVNLGGTGFQVESGSLGGRNAGGNTVSSAPVLAGLVRLVGAADKSVGGGARVTGTLRWEAGQLLFARVFDAENLSRILAEGTFEIASDADLVAIRDPFVPSWIEVSGTLRKTGAGAVRLGTSLRVPGGTVDVQAGTMRLFDTSLWTNATVAVAEAARLEIRSSLVHEVAGLLSGAPVGAFVVGAPGENPKLVAGPGGGALNLGGTGLQIANAEFGTNFAPILEPPVNRGLVRIVGQTRARRTFRSEGTLRWEAGQILFDDVTSVIDVPGVFEVAVADPTATLTTATSIFAPQAFIAVPGTLRKTGAGRVTFNSRLRLTGAVDVQEGELRVAKDGRWENTTVAVADGARLVLASNRGFEPQIVSGTVTGDIAGTFQAGPLEPGAFAVVLLADPETGGTLALGGTGLRLVNAALGGGFDAFATFPAPRNAGLLVVDGTRYVNMETDVVNTGTIRWVAGIWNSINAGVRTLTNLGRIEVETPGDSRWLFATPQNSFAWLYSSRIINAGTIAFGGGPGVTEVFASTFNDGRIEVAEGRTVVFRPTNTNTFQVSATGSISGTGTLDATAITVRPQGQPTFPVGTFVQGGTVAPGADGGAGTGALGWVGASGPGRVALDLASPSDHDHLAASGPPLDLSAATLVVRPGPGVQLGQTFDVVEGAVAGLPAQIVSLRADLGFAAEATASGLRLTAVEPPADAPIAALPARIVGGGTREVLLTGQPFGAGSTVRLECTDCLDPIAAGTVPGEVVSADGGTATVRFPLLNERVLGRYAVVVSAPGLPDRRGPVTVVPLVSVPVLAYTGPNRVPVVPTSSYEGYRYSELRVFNVSNSPEETIYALRLAPPASPLVRTRLTRFGDAQRLANDAVWTRGADGDDGLLLLSLRPGEMYQFGLGTGISPENVDFTTAPTLTVAPPTLAGDVPRDPVTGCSVPQPLGPAWLARDGDELLPFGAVQDLGTEIVRGLGDSDLAETVGGTLEDGFCPRFFDLLGETYPTDGPARLRGAIEAAADALRAVGSMKIDAALLTDQLTGDGPPRSFVELIAAELAGTVPASEWENAARQCGGGGGFGRELTARIRTRVKASVDALRAAGQSGNPVLDEIQDAMIDELRTLGQSFAASAGFSADAFEAALEVERQSLEDLPPCSPLPEIRRDNARPIGGAWDPNDKTGDTRLPCEPGVVIVDGEEQVRCLRYYIPLAEAAAPVPFTVHFENLPAALAAAERVEITDVLDPAFDPATLRVTGSSADSLLTVSMSGQTVTFLFDEINLPPNVNAPEGQGFVSFEVSPRSPLPDGQVVRNGASIVFDFNPPIVTPNVEYAVRQVADPALALTWAGLPDGGRPYTTTWTVTNAGPDAAPGAALDLTVVGGAVTELASTDGACDLAALRCTFGTLGVGATASVTLTAVPDAFGGVFELDGTARTTVVDGFLYNSRATFRATVGVVDAEDDPSGLAFGLDAPAPNPVRDAARLSFTLAEAGAVSLVLFDVQGRAVRHLLDGAERAAGRHETTFHAAGLAAGVYVARLSVDGQAAVQRLSIVR